MTFKSNNFTGLFFACHGHAVLKTGWRQGKWID